MVLIDSSVLISGQADPQRFAQIVQGRTDLATCDAAVGEYEVGLYAPREKKTRQSVKAFAVACVYPLRREPHLPEDFREASRLIGEAIFASKARPSFPDGLIAACALRMNGTVWTRDETDFKAMGCQTFNPFASKQRAD